MLMISGVQNNEKPYTTFVKEAMLTMWGDQNNEKPYKTLVKVDSFTVQGARSRSRKRGPEAGRPKNQLVIKRSKLDL